MISLFYHSFLYGYETWSLTLREGHKFNVFENRVLRIFGPEVVGDWRRLHNEELHNLYASPHITRVIKSRRMKWIWDVAHMGEMRSTCRIVIGKPEGKKSLTRPRRRSEDNIRMDHRGISWEVADWMHLAQDSDQWRALMNVIVNLRVS
jgi:hypothetical protein